MTSFDYINSSDLRQSIVSDFAEMRRCADSESWKSVQVLAGSIVECLLVDYLVSTTNASRATKDPLKMDLAEAIDICRSEGVLTARTADLCSVVRSYRNLIHPGRMVRLNEAAPDKASCDIAVALIDLIVGEVAKIRRAAVGLTGEQVLSKVIRDPGAVTILPHLMAEVNDEQRERILRDLLPTAYFETVEQEEFDGVHDRLSAAFRSIFESSADGIKKRITQQYAQVVKADDGDRVAMYQKAFFRAPDLKYLEGAARAMVKEHLLAVTTTVHNLETLRLVDGIGEFLEDADCIKWFDPFMRTLASRVVEEHVKMRARAIFNETVFFTTKEFDKRLHGRVNAWALHYEKLGAAASQAIAKELAGELALGSPP